MIEPKSYLIVGLGRFGVAICDRLVELRQRVVGVDVDRQRVEDMAERLEITAQVDAVDEEALAKIGAKSVDVAVVAIGEDVKASVLTTAILVEMGIPYVVSRAIDHLHARVLEKVGAHRVLSPEKETGLRTADQLVHPWMTRFSAISSTDLMMGDIAAMPEMEGKSLMDLKFPTKYKAIVLMIERGKKRFMPKAETVVEKGDRLWLTGERDNLCRWLGNKDEERCE